MPKRFKHSDRDEYNRRLRLVAAAFSPSSPITSKELFAGRASQLTRLFEVMNQKGQHAIIYGERGVGKTSIARVMHALHEPHGLVAYYTCHSGDTFKSIWLGILDELQFSLPKKKVGFAPADVNRTVQSASTLLADRKPDPSDVRRVLSMLSFAPIFLFIDEFDRVQDPKASRLMADTVKILSDQGVDATIVIIGVATSVSDLIAEHASVARPLIQIHMPLMTVEESAQIVYAGMKAAELAVEDGFVDHVVRLSQGLPHYTHLIAQHGARHAVDSGFAEVTTSESTDAVTLAMSDVSQTIRQKYHDATYSNRDTLHKQVLLACAAAEKNAVGAFGSAAVREALHGVAGRLYEIPAFSAHLSAFSTPTHPRGGVLQKLGTRARYDYRFIDPLMPPYVLMKGHAEGLI